MEASATRRIIVEIVSPSQRRYHVSSEFGCRLENGITLQQVTDILKQQQSEEQMQELLSLMQQYPRCSMGEALDTLERCEHDHNGKAGIVDVTINLAFADWSIMQKKVLKLISTNLAWLGDYIEVSEAR